MKIFRILCLSLFATFSAGQAQAATMTLSGTLGITAGYLDPSTGLYGGGSYFAMGSNAPNSSSAVFLSPGSAGGITLGSYQAMVPNPDVPHPYNWDGNGAAAGTGYSTAGPTTLSTLLATFSFFGTNTYVGTDPVSFQTGVAHPAPTATVDTSNCTGTTCAMSIDLSSWEVLWDGNMFDQGPRASATAGFIPATGTYDTATHQYSLTWGALIVGGPFNGVTGYWHLEGTLVPTPIPPTAPLFLSGLVGLMAIARRKRTRVSA